MASSREVKAVNIKVTANDEDIKKLQKKLKTLEKVGKETGEGIGTALKAGIATVLTGALFSKVSGLFKGAIEQANKYEVALTKVAVSAGQSGQSVDKAREAVLKLAKDGTLSVESVSNAMALMLEQGSSIDDAFSFIEAGKKVGTFKKITDDTGQAVFDFIKGIGTMSADLVENLSPSLRTTINELGGLAKVSKDAGLKQKLFNAVIAQGNSLNDDYAKFMETSAAKQKSFTEQLNQTSAALGKELQPSLNSVISVLGSALGSFTEFFKTLGGISKAIIIIVPTIGALTLAISGLAAGFGLLTLSLPVIGQVIGAVTLLTAGAIALSEAFKDSPAEKQANDLEKLSVSYRDLADNQEKTVEQQKELLKIEKQLADTIPGFTKGVENNTSAVRDNIDAINDQIGLIEDLGKAQKITGGQDFSKFTNKTSLISIVQGTAESVSLAKKRLQTAKDEGLEGKKLLKLKTNVLILQKRHRTEKRYYLLPLGQGLSPLH